jgi:hypothetical protein
MTRVRYDRLVDVGIFGPDDRVLRCHAVVAPLAASRARIRVATLRP